MFIAILVRQLNTRLYGFSTDEFSFLALLPPDAKSWIKQMGKGVSDSQREYLMAPQIIFATFEQTTN
jgi:hypothetical protein